MNPNAWRRTPLSRTRSSSAPMIDDPLTQYMFCSPAEGGGGARAAPPPSGPTRSPTAGVPALGGAALPPVRLLRGVQPGARRRARRRRRRVAAAAGAFEMAGIGPDEIDVAQVQDTESGAEIMHLAECGFCADGEQEDLIRSGGTEIDGRCRSTPTAAASPTASRSARRACARCTSRCVQLRGDGRRAPGARRPADRVHPRLRRARHLRLHRAHAAELVLRRDPSRGLRAIASRASGAAAACRGCRR